MNPDMKQNAPNATTDKRTCYVGAKVTPMQRETIRTLAARCGMTVSDYLLARSHDYEPKHRLTSRQTDALAKLNYATLIDYTQYRAGATSYTLERDGKEQRFYIPEKVLEFFDNEFDYRETANCEDLTNFAVALFIGVAGGPASAPSGGGGGYSTNNNWGRNKDEDDLRWAHRCAKAATQKLGKQPKSGLKR